MHLSTDRGSDHRTRQRGSDPDGYVATAAACALLGGVSEMTVRRWRKKFQDFPRPIVINGQNYYRRADLHDFMARRAADAEAA